MLGLFLLSLSTFVEGADCTDRFDVFSFGSIVYEILTEMAAFLVSMSPFDVIRTFGVEKWRRSLIRVALSCGH
jgi:hypothetical protein